MYKNIGKITLIIGANLFAFLLLGSILGLIFGNRGLFLVGSVIFSLLPLTFFLFIEIKKTIGELDTLSKEKKYDTPGK